MNISEYCGGQFFVINKAKIAGSQELREKILRASTIVRLRRLDVPLSRRDTDQTRWFGSGNSPHVLPSDVAALSGGAYMELFEHEMAKPEYRNLPKVAYCKLVDSVSFMGEKIGEIAERAGLDASEELPFRVLDLGPGRAIGPYELLLWCNSQQYPLALSCVDLVEPNYFWREGAAIPNSPIHRLTNESLSSYRKLVESGQLHHFQCSMDSLPPNIKYPDVDWTGTQHLVVSKGALRYVQDVIRVFEEVYRILAPGGEAYLVIDLDTPTLRVKIDGEIKTFSLRDDILPQLRIAGFEIEYQSVFNRNARVLKIVKDRNGRPLNFGLSLAAEEVSGRKFLYYERLQIPPEDIGFIPTYS